MPHLPELFEQLMDLAVAVTQLAIVLTPLIILFVKALGTSGQLQISIPMLIAWITILTESVKFVTGAIQGWIGIMVWLGGIFDWARGIIRDWLGFVMENWRRLGDLVSYIGGMIGGIIQGLVNSMWNAGRNLIGNIVNGIFAAIPWLRDAASYAASVFRSFWPFSPAKAGPLSGRGDLRRAGQNMVGRLVDGLDSKTNALAAAANNLASLLQFGGTPGIGGVGVGTAGGGGAGTRSVPNEPAINYFMVQVGDRPVREMVQAEIVSSPELVASAATEGNRSNASLSGRKRIGDG
jgi:phage-related protein